VGRILTVTYTWARRCAVALIGGTVVLVGIVMIVTPGPAFVVIPAGLGILSIEFAFARRWLKRLKTTGTEVVGRTRVWLRPAGATPATQRDSDFRRNDRTGSS
jgi:tellurite resistance protein TerC